MDLQHLSAILELLTEKDVTAFQYKDADYSLKLRLGPELVAAPVQMASAAPSAAVAAPTTSAPVEDSSLKSVNSPLVGTFYRAPAPESPVYASVGDMVSKGQTLCIVEAMKLMNEIEADESGEIVEILVENAQPVQFGQALFKIRPV